jgi:hypothetical protein
MRPGVHSGLPGLLLGGRHLQRLRAPPERARRLTYSTTARGLEFMMGYYGFLDRTPLGRNEGDPPQLWIRRHDEYHDPNATSQ